MNNAIEVNGLRKRYKNFLLDNISFSVPSGYVCGFIGQNGAGKTTTLKLLLGMALKDDGETKILGKSNEDVLNKENLGVLLEQPYFQEDWTPADVEKAMRPFYVDWDSTAFHKYLQAFSLDNKQKFKTMSRGMKMKLGMAVTLSHNAKLLILDEPTSGLDPVAREEMLDICRDFMVKEDRSIFFSTHITSDLEKIADNIVYLHKGRIIFSGAKEELLDMYCIVRGGTDDLPRDKRRNVIGLREHVGGFEGMMLLSDVSGLPGSVITEPVTLDDIMVNYSRKVEYDDL